MEQKEVIEYLRNILTNLQNNQDDAASVADSRNINPAEFADQKKKPDAKTGLRPDLAPVDLVSLENVVGYGNQNKYILKLYQSDTPSNFANDSYFTGGSNRYYIEITYADANQTPIESFKYPRTILELGNPESIGFVNFYLASLSPVGLGGYTVGTRDQNPNLTLRATVVDGDRDKTGTITSPELRVFRRVEINAFSGNPLNLKKATVFGDLKPIGAIDLVQRVDKHIDASGKPVYAKNPIQFHPSAKSPTDKKYLKADGSVTSKPDEALVDQSIWLEVNKDGVGDIRLIIDPTKGGKPITGNLFGTDGKIIQSNVTVGFELEVPIGAETLLVRVDKDGLLNGAWWKNWPTPA